MDTDRTLQMKLAAEMVLSGELSLEQYERFLDSMEATLNQKEGEIKSIEIPMEFIEELRDELETAFTGMDCYNDGLREMREYLNDEDPRHLELGLQLVREGNELIRQVQDMGSPSPDLTASPVAGDFQRAGEPPCGRCSAMQQPPALSLRIKLVLTIVPLIILFMGFNFFVILRHEEDILKQETEQQGLSIATGLAATSAYAISSFTPYLLQTNVDSLARGLKDVRYIIILDETGHVLAHTDPQETGKLEEDDLSRQAMASSHSLNQDVPGQRVVDISWPIEVPTETGNQRKGTIRVGLSLDNMDAALASSKRYLLLLTGALMLGAIIFMVMLAHYFVAPILTLVAAAHSLAAGNLDTRAQTRSNDEVGVLAEAFNDMAVKLQGMMTSEKAAREKLQHRVADLLAFTDRVAHGDLTGHAPIGDDDEMGRLVAGFNAMVDELRTTMEQERRIRDDLESSKQALEEANEKLKELDKLKSEFLNTVSHELRTPLTSIKAFSEILLDNQGEDREVQMEFLSIINQESDRLTRLINNLLDLSRIEAGQMQWERSPVTIEEVASTSVQATRSLIEKKKLSLIVDCPGGLITLGDRDKLIQVLNNLLSNAIKFTPQNGRLWLTARQVEPEHEIEIAVRDSGIGIPSEFHERIFEKFQQVDTSSTREAKGSGLGLPIVRSILEAHAGRVWVESKPGSGSTFLVRLPLVKVEETRRPSTQIVVADAESLKTALANTGLVAGDEAGGNGKPDRRTILVVDDEQNIVRVLRHILESEGHEVVEAFSGKEALQTARTIHPDLILLDVLLPDMDGFHVLDELRKDPTLVDTPVIILSIIEAREHSFQLGAQDYFSKPIDLHKLLDSVSRLVQDSPPKEVKILVVDDEPNIVQAVTTILQQRGYTTLAAKDGLEAVVRARDSQPDLIIMDIYMPDMDGFEAIKRLRAREETCQIPVIILTASQVPLDEIRANSLGVAQYMTKPFSEKDLAKVVKTMLGNCRRTPS